MIIWIKNNIQWLFLEEVLPQKPYAKEGTFLQ
jgi:hypothetical protein